MSLIRPETVGNVAISVRLTEVAAPVRAELKTVSDWAVTVTVSVTVIPCTSYERSVATPRLTMMSVCVDGSNAAAPVPV